MPLQHVLCLLTSQTLKGAAWAQSSLSACCQALCCSQHLCFTPCLHACVALSSANRILRGGRPLKSCCMALQVDCMLPLPISVSAEVSSEMCSPVSGARRLQLGVSVPARYSQGSPCSQCATVHCWVWGFGIKKVVLFT